MPKLLEDLPPPLLSVKDEDEDEEPELIIT
jgi:hypothetical protein